MWNWDELLTVLSTGTTWSLTSWGWQFREGERKRIVMQTVSAVKKVKRLLVTKNRAARNGHLRSCHLTWRMTPKRQS